MEDQEVLAKLKPLPGQLVVIERGTQLALEVTDRSTLRGAISNDMGKDDGGLTLNYYVDGKCLGTEKLGSPCAEVQRKLLEVLEKTKQPVKGFSVPGNETVEVSRGELLSGVKEFLSKAE